MKKEPNAQVNYYNAYNLGIRSALPLPELQASAEAVADVSIRFGHLSWAPPSEATESEDLYAEVSVHGAHFFWKQLGKFLVRGGREIIIDPRPGVENHLLRLPVLGTLLAVLLHQRGFFVLHASAIAIDGQAVIFVGNKGRGKSTMAAALYGRGHQLLSDDIVALSVDHQGLPVVLPGFPHFKLYPEAVISCLGDDPNRLPEIAEGFEKRARRVSERFAEKAVPLNSIYALGGGPVSKLKLLGSQDAVLLLIANSYMARFGKQILHGAEASEHLRKCSTITTQVLSYKLERPHAMALLPLIAGLVEENIEHLNHPAAA